MLQMTEPDWQISILMKLLYTSRCRWALSPTAKKIIPFKSRLGFLWRNLSTWVNTGVGIFLDLFQDLTTLFFSGRRRAHRQQCVYDDFVNLEICRFNLIFQRDAHICREFMRALIRTNVRACI